MIQFPFVVLFPSAVGVTNMSFMDWKDSYSVNVKEIDDQHRILFKMISEFYENIESYDQKLLSKLLKSLVEYTEFHFSTEERYFRLFKFEEAGDHVREHQIFVAKVKDFSNRLNDERMVMSLEITNFLKMWLTEHIDGTDRKYTKCFNDNGIL